MTDVTSVTWSILIATLARRGEKLLGLLSALQPQMLPGVEVVAYRNHGERPLGDIRQALVEEAAGEYVSFIDDDDRPAELLVPSVLPLLDGVDYVGWRMQAYIDGQPLKPTFHSLRYREWSEGPTAYFRDVSHLNPVRRELALKADFRRAVPPEDVSWSDQMRPYVETENYTGDDWIAYHYYASSTDSSWRPGSQDWQASMSQCPDLPDIAHPWFRWHSMST